MLEHSQRLQCKDVTTPHNTNYTNTIDLSKASPAISNAPLKTLNGFDVMCKYIKPRCCNLQLSSDALQLVLIFQTVKRNTCATKSKSPRKSGARHSTRIFGAFSFK
jgi:hypothetical protein